MEPDPSGNITLEDGIILPAGKLGPSPHKNVSCVEHQYIAYDEAQSKIKYALVVKWNF